MDLGSALEDLGVAGALTRGGGWLGPNHIEFVVVVVAGGGDNFCQTRLVADVRLLAN